MIQVIVGIIALVINFTAILLPYYIAYVWINPQSFMGVVGVFVLGSILAPLAYLAVGLIFAPIITLFKNSNRH